MTNKEILAWAKTVNYPDLPLKWADPARTRRVEQAAAEHITSPERRAPSKDRMLARKAPARTGSDQVSSPTKRLNRFEYLILNFLF